MKKAIFEVFFNADKVDEQMIIHKICELSSIYKIKQIEEK